METPESIGRVLNPDHEQAAEGAAILNRLVPAPDHGAGFRRDPETGFVYYSSEWLSVDEYDAELRAAYRREQE